ncbi:hypothetical protein [Streptomyces sp. NPDC006285]|uniref:hypothetical protein n=1 Tax=Streptomyces sp. NPDC006285 TaxID=3364742 RepID=UPI0036C7AED5
MIERLRPLAANRSTQDVLSIAATAVDLSDRDQPENPQWESAVSGVQWLHARRPQLRRRLVVLSARLWWHPFWSAPGRAPAARAQLRSHTRALHEDARRTGVLCI